MHGRMHPNEGLVTVLLAHDPLSSLAYPMISHTPLVASNLSIKTLVAMAMANKFSYISSYQMYAIYLLYVQVYNFHF